MFFNTYRDPRKEGTSDHPILLYVYISWCFCLVFQRDYHTADSVHITAANSTGFNLDVDIYTRLELETSIVAPTAQLTIVAERLQLELIITTKLD